MVSAGSTHPHSLTSMRLSDPEFLQGNTHFKEDFSKPFGHGCRQWFDMGGIQSFKCKGLFMGGGSK